MKLNLSLLVTLLMVDTVLSQCRTANWWRSFDSKGWSKCGATTEYVTGFYRNNQRSDDPIFLLEEAKCCKAPAPNQNRASTCKTANWWGVLDSNNRWALCPTGYFLQGLYRNTGNSLHHIEEGHCCKPNNLPSSYLRCYDHDVGKSFDNKGWSSCDSEYYMAGFYKGGCDKLYCIEKFRCCMMYDGCKFANWWGAFDHKGWVQCDSSNHYITGLWRNNNRGSNDKISLLEEAKCCPAPSPNQNTASTCKTANWWTVLDKKNTWAVCPNGYFVQGFYRGSGDWLHNIEEAKCCKPNTFPDRYEHCYNENILSSFDNKGLSKCKQEGYYVAGIYRGGCDRLYCIETLKCCKMNVDECTTSNPCKNGGKCSDLAGSYHCNCKSGYHGNNCQYDINECENNPCKNGATCVNLQGSYRCDCKNGYTGNNCEKDINECSNSPCKNGATCVNLVGSYRCDCKTGYSGNNCETDINECSPDPCENGGTCVDLVGSYRCDCKTGYSGNYCQRDEEPPVFTYCPSDITIDDAATTEVRVHWQRATATDNSGVEPAVYSEKQSGQFFDVPGSYEVVYTATDQSGNEARTCSFRITLKRKTCPLYQAPKNGALACTEIISSEYVCVVMCRNGFDFEFNPAMLYYCSAGEWQYYATGGYSHPRQLPWPDCSNPTNPSTLKQQGFTYFFFDGDANDPNVQAAIKTNYIDFMTKSNMVPPFFCLYKPTECNKDTVEVNAGYYRDEVPPVFTYCPSDITIANATTTEVKVHWQTPTATDNSGVRPALYSEKQPGQYFDVPGSYEVLYTARDDSGNRATCSFRITLSRKTCPLYQAPKNGALACNEIINSEYVCVVMCKDGFDFEVNPAMLYYCSAGEWQYYVPLSYSYPQKLPWPDCSNPTDPSYLKLNEHKFPYFFFVGDANDPNVQAAIKKNYIDFMANSYMVPPFFCQHNPLECNENTVEVYAGSS